MQSGGVLLFRYVPSVRTLATSSVHSPEVQELRGKRQSSICICTAPNRTHIVLGLAGLPGEMFASVDKALDERTIGHNPERLNLLKGGIIYSNKVRT